MALAGLGGSLGWFEGCLLIVRPPHESHKFSFSMRLSRPFSCNQAYVAIIGMDYVSQLLLALPNRPVHCESSHLTSTLLTPPL